MKRITTLLLFCVLVMLGYAGPVSRNEALQTAKDYLQKKRYSRGHNSTASDLVLAYECLPKSTRGLGVSSPLYYIFNVGSEGGFVVVSGDDRMTPILGDVEQGSFAESEIHAGMRWWMQALEQTMLDRTHSDIEDCGKYLLDVSSDIKAEVAPMVKVQWGQDVPHNGLCPMDSVHGKRSLVGCTAVAIAQVLSKWRYPAHATGKINYTTYLHQYQIREDLSDYTFEWDKMMDYYGYDESIGSEESRKAVAKLMYACGVSVYMDYCGYASGATIVATDLERHFDLDEGCNSVDRIFFTKAEWDQLIKKELSAGRPVIYGGYSMDTGHSFVCDGYNKEGLFHINWGWCGSLDGYFALAELNSAVESGGAPTDETGNFNLDQDVVYGIQPKGDEGVAVEPLMYFNDVAAQSCTSRGKVSFAVKHICTDGNGFFGEVALGVYDKDNLFVGIVGGGYAVDVIEGEFYDNLNFTGALPQKVKNGTYTVRPVCKTDNGEYRPMVGRKGSPFVDHLTLKVEGDAVSVAATDASLAKLKLVSAKPVSAKAYAGGKNVLEIALSNEGNLYNGPVVLVRNDGDKQVRVYHNNYIIEKGETVSFYATVEAPEGVEEDSLSVYISTGDNDLSYTNGYYQELLATFAYSLQQPAAGNPKLVVTEFKVNNVQAYLDAALDIDISVMNEGGFYNKDLFCFVFPGMGGNSLGYVSKKVFLDKGDSISLNMQLPISGLEDGEYFINLYQVVENSSVKLAEGPTFYVKSTDKIVVDNDEGYGVYRTGCAFKVPEGVQCGVLSAVTNLLDIDYCYTAGDTLPANTPVVVKAEQRGTYAYNYVVSDKMAPAQNVLMSQVDAQGYTFAGVGDYLYYRFAADGQGVHYGFYLVNEGKPYHLDAHECYLALPREEANPNGYAFDGFETGIEGVPSDADSLDNAVIYNLTGVRMNCGFSVLPKGIYIINGKKVVK